MVLRALTLLFLCAACQTVTSAPADETHAANSQLLIRVVRLEHTQPKDVAKQLQQRLVNQSPGLAGLKVAEQPEQNALVLSGTSAQIQQALELLAQLDVPPRR